MKYIVKYHTGAGDFEFNGTLEDAMRKAENGLSYTNQPVSIYVGDKEIARLSWWEEWIFL